MESTTGYTFYPLCGIVYFPWHRHQIEGTNGFYCLIRKTGRFTISNVESQVFTPNNSGLHPGIWQVVVLSIPGGWCDVGGGWNVG